MAKPRDNYFEINSHKASIRVTINSIMMGSLFFVLTLIWTTDPLKFSTFTVAQIILAVPLLYVSSLAYSKIGYAKKVIMWDVLGWFTNTIGSIFILNAIGLMTAAIYKDIALTYFLLMIILMVIYSVINIKYTPNELKEKMFKLVFFLIIMTLGGLLPLLFSL